MAENVIYKPDARRFEYSVGGTVAVCDYIEEGSTWTFTHTYVPPEFRGQGVAVKLVTAALEQARREKKTVVPACSYVAKFIEQSGAYNDLLKS